MPVPLPNLYPEFNIVRLSHACLNVSDIATSKRFYTDILGFDVTDETDSHIYLRAMEERGHHCLILQKSALAGTVEVMDTKPLMRLIWIGQRPILPPEAVRQNG